MSTMSGKHRPLLASVDDTRRVVDTLETLCHYKEDFKEFPETILDMIYRGGRNVNTATHLHPGKSGF